MEKFSAIGLMSGSSLDGLDLAYCEFYFDTYWRYEIIESVTIQYPEEWIIALKEMPNQKGERLIEYDVKYGKYLAKQINKFINDNRLKPDIISSHGHTIFHNPAQGYTLQLGNGQAIATETGITTICDFRIGDIQLGGQGAPLVPIGDELLFNEYDFCINIGGIANISFVAYNKRVAFDICPANQLLNYLSKQVGKDFDYNGNLARLGKMNIQLFNMLNNHSYYSLPYPKSMSNQLVTNYYFNLLDENEASLEDKLYTVCKHIAFQINEITKSNHGQNILITGGGAHNGFLIMAIKKELTKDVIIPDEIMIDFKEALIFAFMGVLRIQEKVNCLASSTGANKDSSSGVIYQP